MKLAIDGVFFQLSNSGIARVWASLLPRLAKFQDLEILLLDRGGCPSVPGTDRLEFPSLTHTNSAADSFLLDSVCSDWGAELFISSYYTTPVTIPSVLLVYDMIPEVFGIDMSARAWQEKETAISFASYYACISENTRRDLLRVYPHISSERVIVAHCGVNRELFYCPDEEVVAAFKKRFQIEKPYFLTVGSRSQVGGYKNGALLFQAARKIREDVEIVCVGGGQDIPESLLDMLPSNVSARRIQLEDRDLACAYAGALALVYPSLYEGFGMPPVEAMACGCPVITTERGSLGEVCGKAALYVSGKDENELRQSLLLVMDPGLRTKLVDSGLRRASFFCWDEMAQRIRDLLEKTYETRNDPATRQFLERWKMLRHIQAQVDIGI